MHEKPLGRSRVQPHNAIKSLHVVLGEDGVAKCICVGGPWMRGDEGGRAPTAHPELIKRDVWVVMWGGHFRDPSPGANRFNPLATDLKIMNAHYYLE